jgi:CAAX protease family protein
MTEPSAASNAPSMPAITQSGRTRPIDLLWIILVAIVGLVMAGVASVLIGLATGFITRALKIDVVAIQIDLMQGVVVTGLILTAAIFGFGGAWLARRRGIDGASLGFRGAHWIWFALALALFGLFLWVDGIITDWIDPTGEISRQTTGSFLFRPDSLIWIAIVFLAVGPITAAAEETLFRGLLYRWFRERTGVVLAAILSAVLFSASHLYFLVPGGFPGQIMSLEIVAFGVIAAGLYQASGSLWPAILFHALNNATVVLSAYTGPTV